MEDDTDMLLHGRNHLPLYQVVGGSLPRLDAGDDRHQGSNTTAAKRNATTTIRTGV